VFGTNDEMKQWAERCIADLKSRGFDKAGLYDPPGVSGTHVMFVLQDADKPEIYAGLPNNPRISPLVEAWKGVSKYAGMAIIGLSVAAGFLHHILQGPNRVSAEDEQNADRLAGDKT
jgi:formate dehydrogenase iron-sulfur subunit